MGFNLAVKGLKHVIGTTVLYIFLWLLCDWSTPYH